jgi:hypothetical protein
MKKKIDIDRETINKLKRTYYNMNRKIDEQMYKDSSGNLLKSDFKSFDEFRDWSISNGYKPGEVHLHRKDKNRNFSSYNCLWKEVMYKSRKKFSDCTKLKLIYWNNKARCEKPEDRYYERYGGRGIKWKFKSMEHFRKWSVKNGYEPGNSMLLRKNKDGDFSPRNCYWGSRRNTRMIEYQGKMYESVELSEKLGINHDNFISRLQNYTIEEIADWDNRDKEYLKRIEYNGETVIMRDLAEENGLTLQALQWRLDNGWSMKKALSTPLNKRKMPKKFKRHIIEYKGDKYTVEEIADILDMKEQTIRGRIRDGWTPKQIMETPKGRHASYKISLKNKSGQELGVRELSEKYNLPEGYIRHRIKSRGITTEKELTKVIKVNRENRG